MVSATLYNLPILIVDDLQESKALLAKQLRKNGFQNVHATSFLAIAADLVQRHVPALVIFSLNQHNLNGLQTMQQLAALPRRPLILTLLVDAGAELRHSLLDYGADDFLVKPANIVELQQRILVLLRIAYYQAQHKNLDFEEQTIGGVDLLDSYQRRLITRAEDQLELIKRISLTVKQRAYVNLDAKAVDMVAQHVARLACAMGVPQQRTKQLKLASYLYDIGTLATPESILQKPSELNRQEREIVQHHPLAGAELLAKQSFDSLELARYVTLHHHERWDGSGYPFQKVGEETPLEAQIVSLVDVFSSVQQNRPYRSAMTMTEAISLLRELRGRWFNPVLVDTFIDHVKPLDEASLSQ